MNIAPLSFPADSASERETIVCALVIDPEDTSRVAITVVLCALGCYVKTIRRVDDALTLMRREPFNLVSSALLLPQKQRLEIAHFLRRRMAPAARLVLASCEEPMEARRFADQVQVALPPRHPTRKTALTAYERNVGRTLAPPAHETLANAEDAVASQTAAEQTLRALAKVLEAKDLYTFDHSDRVALYAARLAKRLKLDPTQIARIYQGGLMHDIGKIAICSSDLNQQGPLSREQQARFRLHPVYGRRMIESMPALHALIPAIYHHHEAYDGSGYPDGLSGKNIPLDARILCVADSYDAMTSDRAYRPKMSHQAACQELVRCAGTQFDPWVVDAFL